MKLLLFFLTVGILSAGDLRDLESSFTSDGPFVAGKLLTKLKPGIHYLDDANNNQREHIISVHGWKTKGRSEEHTSELQSH